MRLIILAFALAVMLGGCSSSTVQADHRTVIDFSNPADVVIKLKVEGWQVIYNVPPQVVARVFNFCVSTYGTTPIVLVHHPEVGGSWMVCQRERFSSAEARMFCKTLLRSNNASVFEIVVIHKAGWGSTSPNPARIHNFCMSSKAIS